MKKIFLLLFLIFLFALFGCTNEYISQDDSAGEINLKFLDYAYNDNLVLLDNGIVYDKRTNIVYYAPKSYDGYLSLTPFYGSDKELVTKDEYIAEYKEK